MGVIWAEGDTMYETGVDRGVLYIPEWSLSGTTYPGVAWNGLISVEDADVDGEMLTKYVDGIGYLNVEVGRNSRVNVSAFSAPREFSDFVGDKLVVPGFHMTQQPKPRFNFSWRVLNQHGYEIHVLYNCLATPSSESDESISDSVEPKTFSWVFDATPDVVPNIRPTAHFIIDPAAHPSVGPAFEDLMYGTDLLPANCPTPAELLIMFD